MEGKMKHILNICIFSSVFLFSCSIIAFTIVLTYQCSKAVHDTHSTVTVTATSPSKESSSGIRLGSSREYLRQNIDNFEAISLDLDLDEWEPPFELQQNFPYYLSGFDDANRPIWIAELGKWNIRKIVEEGRGKLFEKYVDQALYRFNKSISLRSSRADVVRKGVAIIDMENYDLTQAASIPTLQLMLRKGSDVVATVGKFEKGIFLNANFLAETLINLVRRIMGPVLSRVEVYGTNKERWIPKLLKQLPKESLPQWYGGVEDFFPIQVHG